MERKTYERLGGLNFWTLWKRFREKTFMGESWKMVPLIKNSASGGILRRIFKPIWKKSWSNQEGKP